MSLIDLWLTKDKDIDYFFLVCSKQIRRFFCWDGLEIARFSLPLNEGNADQR